jgi:hypothetical protein
LPSPTRLAVLIGYFVNGVDRTDGKGVLLWTLGMDSSLRTTSGYDDVTGIGSPDGAALIDSLRSAGP